MKSENEENENINVDSYKLCSTPNKLLKTPGKLNKSSNLKLANKNLAISTPSRPLTAPLVESTPLNSREAAIQAKLLSTAERIKKVASLKDKWAKEKERKIKKFRVKRSRELKMQQELLLAAAEQRKLAIEKNREIEEKKKQAEKDLLISSLEAAAQLSKDLMEKFKERRRQSICLNNEIMQRAKVKLDELAAQKKNEEDRYEKYFLS